MRRPRARWGRGCAKWLGLELSPCWSGCRRLWTEGQWGGGNPSARRGPRPSVLPNFLSAERRSEPCCPSERRASVSRSAPWAGESLESFSGGSSCVRRCPPRPFSPHGGRSCSALFRWHLGVSPWEGDGSVVSGRRSVDPLRRRLVEPQVTAPPPGMAVSPLPPPDPRFVLRGTQSAVHALHFFGGAEGQGQPLLLSGSLSGLVHIWSLQTRRAVATLDGHRGQCVTWLHSLPQGHQLLSQGRDLKLCLWDLAEGRNAVVDSMRLESMGFCRSTVLARGQGHWMLAMPGRGSDEVQILEMPSKTSVCTLKPEADAKPGMPMCLELWQAESSPRPLLLAGYEDGSVALWDVSERKVCSRVACHTEPVMGFDFDSQKARGVSGSAEKALAVWSLDEQQALQVCKTHELTNPGIADVKIRPDRKILATAGWDHRVRVFHWRTMKPLAVLSFHSATVHCVAFAANGLLAAGSGDQRISIWSLYPISSDSSTPLSGHVEDTEVGAHALA